MERRAEATHSHLKGVLIAMVLAGCGPGVEARRDGGVPAEAPDAAPFDPLLLTRAHAGWRKPLCLGCHTTAPYPHMDAGYVPPACVTCHGANGAPHANHATAENATCSACHADVAHVPTFKLPDDCVVCHYHPADP